MIRDVRHAVRSLSLQPGFTLLAILILGLGIAAATSVFSVVNAVLLRPLPQKDSNRLIAITTGVRSALSGGDYMDVRDEVTTLESIGYYFGGQVNVITRNGAEFSGAAFASPDFFQALGVQAFLAGRGFTGSEDEQAAVITAEFAERNFGSPSAAIDQNVTLYEKPYRITGVVPTLLRYPDKTSVWVKAPRNPENTNRTAHNYRVIGRLREGVSAEQAQAQLTAIAQRLSNQFPQTHKQKTFRATPLADLMVSGSRQTLEALLGAVLVLVLIACANVANLLLARGAARGREIAVRTALGAGSWPVVRMLLAESLTLAFAAAAGGLLLSFATLRAIVAVAPATTPRINEVSIDGRVLIFTVGIAMVATLLFGLLPAWQALRMDIQSMLKAGGGRGVVGGSPRMRRALVVVEIALAFVLTLSAALIFRSFMKLNEVELGFRTSDILVAYAAIPANTKLESQLSAGRWFSNITGKLAELPGVVSASAAMGVPSGTYNSNGSYIVEGKHEWATANLSDLPTARFRMAGPNYFATLGIPLKAGRDFTARDTYESTFVVIVSESLVRQIFPNENPLGRRIQCGFDEPKWMTIVGVVGDVRSTSPANNASPEFYMPIEQHPRYADELQIVLRTSAPPASLSEPVRRLVAAERSDVALRFETLDSMVNGSIALPRFRTVLLSVFSSIAVLLALAGVYGVMSYVVDLRRNEFGVRLALGATGATLARITLREALVLSSAGIAIGLALAVAVKPVIASFLFGVESVDLTIWVLSAAALSAVALLAAWFPARRASSVNPADVLRGE